jgi:hypothetical protein
MTNFYLLISGYLLIFLSIAFFAYRLKKIELTDEDYKRLSILEKRINFIRKRILAIYKIFKEEVSFLLISLKEKILRRIKIEALKIETWANKHLERMKNNQENKEI